MLLRNYNLVTTTNAEEALSGIVARTKQFKNLNPRISANWRYRINRIEIGSVRVGASIASSLLYEQVGSNEIVITATTSGYEGMSVGSTNRENGRLPSFSPLVEAKGEIVDGRFWTVRLSIDKFQTYLCEMELNVNLEMFIKKNWYMPLPGSSAFNTFIFYLMTHIDEYGPLTDSEHSTLEDIIYINSVRLMTSEVQVWRGSNKQEHLLRCDEYIESNLHREITVLELARASGMSIRSLQMTFKNTRNMGVREHIINQRLERARREILTNRETISLSELSARVGFQTPSYFAKLYKRKFGENPQTTQSTYR